MYLYTRDYVRVDIPASLEECYKALDNKLDENTKKYIKNSSLKALPYRTFEIRMWIHSKWIHPANGRIDKVFRDAGYTNTDEMALEIIIGYHYYLNGIHYEINPKTDDKGR